MELSNWCHRYCQYGYFSSEYGNNKKKGIEPKFTIIEITGIQSVTPEARHQRNTRACTNSPTNSRDRGYHHDCWVHHLWTHVQTLSLTVGATECTTSGWGSQMFILRSKMSIIGRSSYSDNWLHPIRPSQRLQSGLPQDQSRKKDAHGYPVPIYAKCPRSFF